ncbi:unnamed protein product [Toxocara canis]|uniref:Tyrosine-protein phosphatase domain-containing protein n=1 Tax=Toxocara canis TaxID=6265 RepID=A0A183U2R9_TOXCA|nr:unnamed protein product [Toxocara canis]
MLGDVQFIKLWLEDTTQCVIYTHFELIADQIQAILSTGGKVLIHSVHGISRSAAICLAYLLKFRCKSLRDAYEMLASNRPKVTPNIGFWRQLIAFEQEIKQTLGSVNIVRDERDPEKLIPDVYTKFANHYNTYHTKKSGYGSRVTENTSMKRKAENHKRTLHRIGGSRHGPSTQFHPVLEPLPENIEVVAQK